MLTSSLPLLFSLTILGTAPPIDVASSKRSVSGKDFVPMSLTHPDKEPISRYRQNRLKSFAEEDVSTLQSSTVFLGDSITHRYPLQRFFRKSHVVNRGIGGDTMGGVKHRGILNRLKSTVYNLNPKRIILLIGVNDILWSHGTAFKTKLAQYDYLVESIRRERPNIELWCISVLPTRGKYAKKNQAIQRFNRHAAKVSKRHGAQWLDLYRYFVNDEGELLKKLARDSVHLSMRGYRRLTAFYKRKIFRARK